MTRPWLNVSSTPEHSLQRHCANVADDANAQQTNKLCTKK